MGTRPLKVGERFKRPGDTDGIGPIRVIVIAEGWAMCRRHKGSTFCETVKVIEREWIPITQEKRSQ